MKRFQGMRGITFMGFLMVLAVVGFFAYAAMRVGPMYIEYYGVVRSMEQLRQEPGSSTKSLEQIRGELQTKFDVQYVKIDSSAISIKRDAGNTVLRVAYQKEEPFAYNISVLGRFDHSIILNKNDE